MYNVDKIISTKNYTLIDKFFLLKLLVKMLLLRKNPQIKIFKNDKFYMLFFFVVVFGLNC